MNLKNYKRRKKLETHSTSSNWPPVIFIVFFAIMFGIFIYFTIIKDYIKNKKVKIVKVEALKGNKYALEMMRYTTFFKYEDEDVIRQALNGNINALKMMGYHITEDNERRVR